MRLKMCDSSNFSQALFLFLGMNELHKWSAPLSPLSYLHDKLQSLAQLVERLSINPSVSGLIASSS